MRLLTKSAASARTGYGGDKKLDGLQIDECLTEIKGCLEKGCTGLGFKFEKAWCAYTGLPHAHFLSSATAVGGGEVARVTRLSPSAILDVNVLDPAGVRPYIRNEAEWQRVVDQIYRPYLDRQGIDYDPTLHTNRVASIDPLLGWNPSWALQRRRFRVLFLANALPSLPAAMIEAIRSIPGAIVINCADWHLSALDVGDLDLIFIVDGVSAGLATVLEAHRRTGTQVVYLSHYTGWQRARCRSTCRIMPGMNT
jgi:hypothetical protein